MIFYYENDFEYEPEQEDLDLVVKKFFEEEYNTELVPAVLQGLQDCDAWDALCEGWYEELKEYFYDEAMAELEKQRQEAEDDEAYFDEVKRKYWGTRL